MSDSIKKRILDAVAGKLATIKSADGILEIRQTRNLDLLETEISPCLLWAAGIEEPLEPNDTRGVTFKFPIAFKIHCKTEDAAMYVAQLQTLIESDVQLGGLCVNIEGGEETPFLNTADTSEGGSFVVYDFTYRRRRGDPSAGY